MESDGPILTDPRVMLGKPTVAGTRITVDLILERLAAGEDPERVLGSYPRLTEEGLRSALRFAWDFLQGMSRGFLEERRLPDPRRPGRLTLDDAIEELTRGALAREGSSAVRGDVDGGFLESVLRKVDAGGVEAAQALDALRGTTLDEATYILEELAIGSWEEIYFRLRGRRSRRGRGEVLVVLAFASEAIRDAYNPRRRPRL